MGSPYFAHKQVNRIHVVRSFSGFKRILSTIARSMDKTTSAVIADRYSPEWVIFSDLLSAYNGAARSNSRTLLFLEARYEWTGWEKFQRVVVFDFSGKHSSSQINTLVVGSADGLSREQEIVHAIDHYTGSFVFAELSDLI